MSTLGRDAYRNVMWRVAAPLALLIILSSIDRVNISFAAMRMNHSIGLSPAAYGLGAGLFFVGYLVFQLPSVALLKRIGARRWIALSVGGWGLVASAMAFVSLPWQFFVLRLLLGAFESGFAPGVVWYVSRWLPQSYRSRSIGLTLLAIPASVIIGGPLSGLLMSLDTRLFEGWRFMFLAEGAATTFLGLAALWWFVDEPAQASWLSADERRAVAEEAAAERSLVKRETGIEWANPVLWLCALIWLALVTGANALIFWLPMLVHASGVERPLAIGFISALPWAAIALGMFANARHSDRSGERFRHLGFAALLAGVALGLAAAAGGSALALALLIVAGLGLGGAQSVFWTIPTLYLANERPTNIALINLAGNASSAVAPAAIGWALQRTGSSALPVYVLALLLLVAAGATVPLSFVARSRAADRAR